MKSKQLLLSCLIGVALILGACDKDKGKDKSTSTEAGVDAKPEARKLVDLIFPKNQNAVEFASAKKYKSGKIIISDFSVVPVQLGKKFIFPQVIINKVEILKDKPIYYDMAFKGLKITDDMFPSPNVTTQLKMMGIDDLILDFNVQSDYQPTAKSYSMKMVMTARKLAGLNFTLDLNNVPEDVLDSKKSADPAQAMMMLSAAKLKHAMIKISNIGLMQALNKHNPQFIPAGKQQLQALANVEQDPLKKQILTSIAKFLDKQSSLTLTVAPAEPLDFGMLMSPASQAEAIKKLNLQIDAE